MKINLLRRLSPIKENNQARRHRGFSILELILTLAIVGILSAMAVTGVGLAVSTYTRTVDAANAQMLLSTASTLLRQKLTMADKITISDIKTIKYQDLSDSKIKSITAGTEFTSESGQTYTTISVKVGSQAEPLLSAKAATSGLYVTYDKVEYANGVITFDNLRVVQSGKSTALASMESFSIRTIAG